MRIEDKFWCLITGHKWYNVNNLPRLVNNNGIIEKKYTEPIYICLGCGKDKKPTKVELK